MFFLNKTINFGFRKYLKVESWSGSQITRLFFVVVEKNTFQIPQNDGNGEDILKNMHSILMILKDKMFFRSIKNKINGTNRPHFTKYFDF